MIKAYSTKNYSYAVSIIEIGKQSRKTGEHLLLKVITCPDELIAFRSVTADGEEWNKFHRAANFSAHQQLGNQGNIAVNKSFEAQIIDVTPVPISCAHQLGAYVTHRQPSQFLGYPRSDENRRDSLPLLDAIFE